MRDARTARKILEAAVLKICSHCVQHGHYNFTNRQVNEKHKRTTAFKDF